ncbi:hypothetical protein HanPSC8_Chr17g0763511 [Helianthus annuus]|nr:hypothetical protein HanPSC8_Chr17g0763511 [Helianthus annuus]
MPTQKTTPNNSFRCEDLKKTNKCNKKNKKRVIVHRFNDMCFIFITRLIFRRL